MESYLRVWKKLDLVKIQKHLFVIGELTGECFACHHLGIEMSAARCPACMAPFRYIGFRRKIDVHGIQRFKKSFPDALFIDFDDFKKALDKSEARKLLDM